MACSEVLFQAYANGAHSLQLARPRKLNTLTLSMLESILEFLSQGPQGIKCLMIHGEGDRAFCAGGDVCDLLIHDQSVLAHFFQVEYQIDHYMYHLSKQVPTLALWDGYTFGGGVGLTMGATFRIATERTSFAMPETKIGLFPDVGASYFFHHVMESPMQLELAMFLALTGTRLNGKECCELKLATHYIPSDKLHEVKTKLQTHKLDEASAMDEIQVLLQDYHQSPASSGFPASLRDHASIIRDCFGKNSVEEILSALDEEGSAWSKDTITQIQAMSPSSVKITHEQITRGAKQNLVQAFEMEYRLAVRCMPGMSLHTDFKEGVRALLIDKDNQPEWTPKTLQEISMDRIQAYFTPFRDSTKEFRPLFHEQSSYL